MTDVSPAEALVVRYVAAVPYQTTDHIARACGVLPDVIDGLERKRLLVPYVREDGVPIWFANMRGLEAAMKVGG